MSTLEQIAQALLDKNSASAKYHGPVHPLVVAIAQTLRNYGNEKLEEAASAIENDLLPNHNRPDSSCECAYHRASKIVRQLKTK